MGLGKKALLFWALSIALGLVESVYYASFFKKSKLGFFEVADPQIKYQVLAGFVAIAGVHVFCFANAINNFILWRRAKKAAE